MLSVSFVVCTGDGMRSQDNHPSPRDVPVLLTTHFLNVLQGHFCTLYKQCIQRTIAGFRAFLASETKYL